MQQYISHLLLLILGTSSTFIITPCQAQTPAKPNSQNTDKINSISPNSSSTIELSDFVNSTNSKSSILSQASSSNSSVADANITENKQKLRVPISSRIFPTPSMQQ
ncbi:hypothetical protein [Nostoc sp. NMS8]|nr:hypothetical protein [Nostoc sp. NMS8]